MNQVLTEFRDFISRGNVIDLAVAVILATAFSPIVTAIVDGVIMPFIAAIVGQPNFDSIGFDINDNRIAIGIVITKAVSFVLIAAAVFFFIVKPMNILKDRQKKGAAPAPEPSEDIVLLREIRDALRNRG
jgi:large conductance mechanosensitive channel